MNIKAFLMQDLSLVAVLVLRYDVTKFPSEEGNESSNSAIDSGKWKFFKQP